MGVDKGISRLPDNVRDFSAVLTDSQKHAAHKRTDREFGLESAPLSEGPHNAPAHFGITYLTYDDVLLRVPGQNYGRIERYVPEDGVWVWHGVHIQQVLVKAKRISETAAVALAEKLCEQVKQTGEQSASTPTAVRHVCELEGFDRLTMICLACEGDEGE